MEQSKVYFSDLRAPVGTNLLRKLEKLIRRAGIGDIDMEKKLVAIKLHFGEPGNLTYLRPNYAKVVADVVKSLGGVPFLTDCNTLYPGRRKNALEHMEAAYENGFSPFSTGCHVIIGDGLRGTDDVEVPVEGAEYIQTAKIGRAIMDADVFISLTHFKGHEATGFGGAIKNIGMGCGSRRGKMEQHNAGKPLVRQSRCVGCRRCSRECGQDAISYGEDGKAGIDQEKCVGCGRCIDISPYGDCHDGNDTPILPDVGMFASFDPVALDQACVDACLKLPVMPGSLLDDRMHEDGFVDHHDHFINTTPEAEWESCLEHAEKIGLGSRSYTLITV